MNETAAADHNIQLYEEKNPIKWFQFEQIFMEKKISFKLIRNSPFLVEANEHYNAQDICMSPYMQQSDSFVDT